MNDSHHNAQRGFTLLELVTAMALFAVIVIITSSVFARFVDVQRRDIDEQAFQEDIRLALGLFNREARGGFGDTYESATINGETSIFFRNQNLKCVRYYVSEQQMVRNESQTAGRDDNCNLTDIYSESDARVLTGADSTIIEIEFRVQPSQVDCDHFVPPKVIRQGFITVLLNAEAAAKRIPLQLQSSVTSRQTNPNSFIDPSTCNS